MYNCRNVCNTLVTQTHREFVFSLGWDISLEVSGVYLKYFVLRAAISVKCLIIMILNNFRIGCLIFKLKTRAAPLDKQTNKQSLKYDPFLFSAFV